MADGLKFSKATDTEHKITLESALIAASWTCGKAIGGQTTAFEVNTELVGERAPVKVIGKSDKGKDLGTVEGVMRRNRFSGRFEIPEDIEPGDKVFFQVELSENGLDGESEHIPAYPPIRVSNLKWSSGEVAREDILTLSADIAGLPNGTEVEVTIYEYHPDSGSDRVTAMPATVTDDRIELRWQYDYFRPADDVPSETELQKRDQSRHYAHPEYFFTIKVEGVEYGRDRESGLVRFRDDFHFGLSTRDGRPAAEEAYVLHLADGSERKGSLDSSGRAIERSIPPGEVRTEFPNVQRDENSEVDLEVDERPGDMEEGQSREGEARGDCPEFGPV